MRILQIVNNLDGGGAEKVVNDLSIGLKNRGHHITILKLFPGDDKYSHTLLKKGIKVYTLSKYKYSLFNIVRLFSFLRKNNFDIIHSHLFPAQLYLAALVFFFRLKTPIVTSEHSCNNRRRRFYILRKLDEAFYNMYNSVIAISDDCKVSFKEMIKSRVPIVTINNGVDLDAIESAPISNDSVFQIGKKYIIMVGRFHESKDQDTLIRSLSNLDNNVILLLVGEGERKKELEDLAYSIGVKDRVVFLGFRTDVYSLMKRSDIVVLSSHWEGLPLSALEAMASGTPFVGSNVEGIKQVCTGWTQLFEEEDYNHLAQICQDLLEYSDKRLFWIDQNNKRAKDFSVDEMVNNHVELYIKIINR